jgi:uncharacterized membrane protein
MTIALAAGAAALSIVGAIGHSVISERKFLRPLYAEPRTGLFASRSARAITRGIFHMPSMVWVVLGLGVLAARIEGGNVLLSIVAATIFTASGAGNIVALRRPHISGLLLVVTGTLTLADLML